MKCPVCGLEAAIDRAEKAKNGTELVYICRNKRCEMSRDKREIGRERIKMAVEAIEKTD